MNTTYVCWWYSRSVYSGLCWDRQEFYLTLQVNAKPGLLHDPAILAWTDHTVAAEAAIQAANRITIWAAAPTLHWVWEGTERVNTDTSGVNWGIWVETARKWLSGPNLARRPRVWHMWPTASGHCRTSHFHRSTATEYKAKLGSAANHTNACF